MKIFVSYIPALSLMLCCQLAGTAQNPIARAPSDAVIAGYLVAANERAVIFNGKVHTPHAPAASSDVPPGYSYHPYLVSADYGAGDIRYNHTLYKGVRLLYDLLSDELIACPEGHLAGIVLEKEKVQEAWLHGAHIISGGKELRQDIPYGNYGLLLHDGPYAVIKKYRVAGKDEIKDGKARVIYSVKPQLYIRIDGVCRPVSSKSSVLKLFPEHKAALNAFAKERRLSFRTQQREQSILSFIIYIESIR